MYKLILVMSVLILTGCNGSSAEHGNVLLQPANVYEVDGWGSNPDIYEFTPKGHPHMTCLLAVSGGDLVGGFECFPKNPQKQTEKELWN